MASDFRDLVAYQAAVKMANELHRAISGWPSFERWTVGIQLMRSADSIGANIAESSGRWHRKDERRLLLSARGSLCETEHWLLRPEERGLLPEGASKQLDEAARALNGLIRKRERQ
jgi:four helix bundle protein